MNTKEFNRTLCDKAQTNLVDFETFKRVNLNKKASTVEGLLARISKVEKTTDGYVTTITYSNGEDVVTVKNDGTFFINNRNKESVKTDSGHIRLAINNVSFIAERWMAMMNDIEADCMPISYKGWTCNVMDCSGNIYTARRLGIKVNISPDNLEWCLKSFQLPHYKVVEKVWKHTGKNIALSAFDDAVQISQTKSIEELIKYLKI